MWRRLALLPRIKSQFAKSGKQAHKRCMFCLTVADKQLPLVHLAWTKEIGITCMAAPQLANFLVLIILTIVGLCKYVLRECPPVE